MKFEDVNNKKTDSTILNLENLSTEYNNVLNMYNQIQNDLNTFANGQWAVNPYLNTNILFTTGEIAYVTNNGLVMLYENPTTAYSLQPDQQNIAATDSQIASENQVISNIQNTIQNTVTQLYNNQVGYDNAIASANSKYSPLISQIPIVGLIEYGIDMAEAVATNTAILAEEDANLLIQKAEQVAEYSSDENVLSGYYQTLNQENAQLASDSAILSTNGCPAIANATPVGLPWISEYNSPGALIPTNPPLLTGTTMTGSIVSEGLSCTNINANIPPPPYDLVEIPNSVYQGNNINNIVMTDTYTPIELCKANCYSTPYCSGATYNYATQICSLSSGSGTIQTSQGSTAIVPKVTQYVLALSQLNFRLTQINQEVMTAIKGAEQDFEKYTNDDAFDNKVLKNRYTKLVAERKKIDELIDSMGQTQNEEQVYGNRITDSNYFKYTLLIVLAIIVIIFLVNISRKDQIADTDGTVHKSLLFIIFITGIIVLGAYILKKYTTNTQTQV